MLDYKQLLSLLLIVVLLTGFSYGIQPGRQDIKESNVSSVAVDDHSQGMYEAYRDTETIRAAVRSVTEMTLSENRTNRPSNNERTSFTVRISFKDASTRTYYVEYYKNDSTVYLHPLNSEQTYEIAKDIIAPVLQETLKKAG